MKVQLSEDVTYNLIFNEKKVNKHLTPVVFLHGFTGSASDWDFLFDKLPPGFFPIAVDLLGHGETSSPNEIEKYHFLNLNDHLKKIFRQLNIVNPILIGYSMGGRAALTFAYANNNSVKGLVLESSTAGLIDYEERLKRIESDEQLADKIELLGIKNFIDYWMKIPLFETLKKLPQIKYEEVYLKKLENDEIGLANSLRGFGTGTMPPLWNELKNFKQKILLITGSKDLKFTGINFRMKRELLHGTHKIVKDAGHNVHLEKPEEFINLVNNFLQELDKD